MQAIVINLVGIVLGLLVILGMLFQMRRTKRLADELAMSRKLLDELAAKAKAYDAYLADRAKPIERSPSPHVDADLEKNYRVAYQHLSAECDSCEEPEPRPRRRHNEHMWDWR